MNAVSFTSRWASQRWVTIMAENSERNTDFSSSNALQFYFGEIIKKEAFELTPELIETYSKYTLVKDNDIIINGLNLNYDFVSQRIGIVMEPGIITSAYLSMRVRSDYSPMFYCYLLKSMDAQKIFHGMGTGIRLTLSYKELRNILLPVPPRDEQDQIVRFLDWTVSSINRLIGIKQKQISVLKELMQAEIERQLYAYPVVDKVRLKQLGTFFKGGGFSRDNLVEDEKYPAILYGDIYTQYEYKTTVIVHHIDSNTYAASRKIMKGDIVMAGTGETKDEIGKSILYMGDQIVAAGGDVIVFRPNEDINVEYLLYQLYSQAALKHRYINGKGDIIVHIYPTALGNTLISLPGEENQVKAVEHINEIVNQVKKAAATLTEDISILREYKVRIISDTVTGKIDVRGIEIPEYNFVDEYANGKDVDIEEKFEEQED